MIVLQVILITLFVVCFIYQVYRSYKFKKEFDREWDQKEKEFESTRTAMKNWGR